MSFSAPPGRLTIRCYQLRRLLFAAYSIRLSSSIPGMPSWGNSARFDIDAKADDATTETMGKLSAKELSNQVQQMLKVLLADRFQLRVHTETRQRPVYNLVIAKSGFKLTPTSPSDQPGGKSSWGNGEIEVRNGPIASLVFCLSEGIAGRNVIDKTGLTGNYDIDLKWTPDDQQGEPDTGPTLLTALEEQLGLKLVPSRGPIDTFVIDRVEKPSEN
jgi:bla regulator protein blaR1